MPESRVHPVLHAVLVIIAFLGFHAPASAAPNSPELMSDLRTVPGRELPSHALAAPGLAGRVHPAALAYARLQLRLPGVGSAIAQRRLKVSVAVRKRTVSGRSCGGSLASLSADPAMGAV